MLGEHCYACGQPVKGLVRHFGSIIGDFLDSVFDLDSRLLRTIGPLLLKPGYLTLEYFSGRRVRYVSPVRLFVFLCIAAFFVLKLTINPDFETGSDRKLSQAQTVLEVERIRDQDLARLQQALAKLKPADPRYGGLQAGVTMLKLEARQRIDWLKAREAAIARGEAPPEEPGETISFGAEPWNAETNPVRIDMLGEHGNALLNAWIGRAASNIKKVQRDPGLLKDSFLEALPQTFIILLPLFALLLKLSYLLKRRLYMEHLIYALHSHAFLCIATLLVVGFEQARSWIGSVAAIGLILQWVEYAVLLWIPVYLWWMQKRVYGQGLVMTTLKFTLIGVIYSVLLCVGALVNLMFSLVTL